MRNCCLFGFELDCYVGICVRCFTEGCLVVGIVFVALLMLVYLWYGLFDACCYDYLWIMLVALFISLYC